jgi:hypothetical protein
MKAKQLFKIKVFHRTYSVNTVDKVLDSEANELDGICMHNTGQILLSKSLSEDNSKEVLLHELIHALDGQLDIGFTEKDVQRTSVALFTLFRDNPKLVKFLFLE